MQGVSKSQNTSPSWALSPESLSIGGVSKQSWRQICCSCNGGRKMPGNFADAGHWISSMRNIYKKKTCWRKILNESHFAFLLLPCKVQTHQTTEWFLWDIMIFQNYFDQMTSAAAAKKLLSTCAWILHIKLFQSWFQAVYLGGSEYLPNLSPKWHHRQLRYPRESIRIAMVCPLLIIMDIII